MSDLETRASLVRSSQSLSKLLHDVGTIDGKSYVVGGRAREALLGARNENSDIDLMVEAEALEEIRSLRIQGSGRNRHGNVRIQTSDYKADIFSPQSFYHGFGSFEEAVAFFDLDVSAVGVALHDRTVLDPVGGAAAIAERRVTPNAERWFWTTDDMERAVLRARLLRFLIRHPDFECREPDMVRKDTAILFERFPEVVRHHVGLTSAEGATELLRRLDAGDGSGGV